MRSQKGLCQPLSRTSWENCRMWHRPWAGIPAGLKGSQYLTVCWDGELAGAWGEFAALGESVGGRSVHRWREQICQVLEDKVAWKHAFLPCRGPGRTPGSMMAICEQWEQGNLILGCGCDSQQELGGRADAWWSRMILSTGNRMDSWGIHLRPSLWIPILTKLWKVLGMEGEWEK